MEIFVIHDGERLGPLSVNDLRLKIDNGTLRPDDYAWVTGMKDWQTISQVLETATRPEAIEANPPPVAKPRNYFVRHWRGDLSLGVSYWVNLFLGNLGPFFVASVLVGAKEEIDLRVVSVLFLCFLVGGTAFLVWQLVGLWRSASHHVSRGGKQGWAITVKALVIIGLVRATMLVWNSYIPQTKEFLSILNGDTGLPSYKIQALPGGTAIEFRGGIRAGCANDLEKVLAANPKTEALDIESPGGRIGEARRMIRLIRARGLRTYTLPSTV